MNEDLLRACSGLEQGDYTCVLCKGKAVYTSRRRGVAPLLELLDSGQDVAGFSAADKVVGKATAYLYCLLGVVAVHGRVLSRPALQVLEENDIAVSYDTLVPQIRNRTQDGTCPMEAATAQSQTPREALDAIRCTLARLQSAP